MVGSHKRSAFSFVEIEMSNIQPLAAEPRERAGKGSARAARRAGLIPAVIYGDKKDPEMITIAKKDLVRLIGRGTFLTSIFNIETNGTAQQVLPRDVQLDPVTDVPIHVDFLRLTKDTKVTIDVPIRIVGQDDSPGLTMGGVLNMVRHTIECICPVTSIPDFFEISVAELDMGGSLHSTAIDLPEGVTMTISDRTFTIATIVAPSRVRSEEEREADEAAEAAALEAELLAEEGEEITEGEAGAKAPADEPGEDAEKAEE